MSDYKVNFTDEAGRELDEMSARTGWEKQEVVCQAISLLKWLMAECDAGSEFAIRRKVEIIRLPIVGAVFGTEMRELVFKFDKEEK